jgi:hypothetical protein
MAIFLFGVAVALAVNLALQGPVSPLLLALIGALAVAWVVRIVDPMKTVREQLRAIRTEKLPARERPRPDA